MALKVIGAGFGQTGTMSMKLALEQLGFGRTYHMWELFDAPQNVRYWDKLSRGEEVDMNPLFEGYQSIVDYPGCMYYKELGAQYPDAKVVLNVRDPHKWWKSSYDTVFNAEPSFGEKVKMGFKLPFSAKLRGTLKVVKMNVRTIYDGYFEGKRNDEEHAVKIFNQHVEDVKAHFPPERLLIFNVKEGWEPLCNFLGVPVPETEFPFVNSREQFPRMLQSVYKGESAYKGLEE